MLQLFPSSLLSEEFFFPSVKSVKGYREHCSLMTQSCPEIEEFLEKSTRVQESEQERQKIETKAHNNSQYKVRQVMFAKVLSVRVIIHTWVAIHVVKIGWCQYVKGDIEDFDIRKKDERSK